MEYLFVDREGATLARAGERIVVRAGALEVAQARAVELRGVLLMGRVTVTGPALDLLLSRSVPVHVLSPLGRYRGCLTPARGPSVNRLMAQYSALSQPERAIGLARESVDAKLSNQVTILRRWVARHPQPELESHLSDVRTRRHQVQRLTTLDALRGVEGAAARSVYAAMASILPVELGFAGRKRRPSTDPPNALLSLFGTLLSGLARSAVTAAGTDPYKGFLHGCSRGSPALALDLTDVYRPMLCLAPTLACFTKLGLDREDFVMGPEGGMRLRKAAFPRAIREFLSRLRSEAAARGRTKRSYAEHMLLDAENLACSFLDPDHPWRPMRIR